MGWDLFCKALLKECAQDFVSYFAPGAKYRGMRECQLQTRVDGPFNPREMRGDAVPEAERGGKLFLLNAEWQSSKDEKMDERLLGYSYELTRLHDLPVRSAVIYTQPVSKVPKAPLVRSIPGAPLPSGNVTIWFNFASLDVCEQSVETFRALDLDAFAVLMLLCKDGGTPAILDEVLERLFKRKDERRESIAATFFFASQVFESAEDRAYLERKYSMVDYSLEANWFYQKVLKEGLEKGLEQGIEQGIEKGLEQGLEKGLKKGLAKGLEKGLEQGLEKGLEQGLEKGRIEEARQNIELFVEKRFPSALAWVKARVEQINNTQTLQEIIATLFTANSEDEVKAAFAVKR